MKMLSIALTLVALAATTRPGDAAMITFSYTGSSGSYTPGALLTASGTGSFTFTNGATTLSAANLTGFSFSQTTTGTGSQYGGTGTYSYTLSDLTLFSASLSATGTLTSLMLQTGSVSPTGVNGGVSSPLLFFVSSLATGAADTYYAAPQVPITLGTVTQTGFATGAVPEPASALMCGMGLVGAGLVGRRRLGVCPSIAFGP